MRIALDLDDVLAAFYPAMCIEFNKPIEKCDIWDSENVNRWVFINHELIKDSRQFWSNLPLLSHPNDINFEVYCYITSSPKSMIVERESWIIRNGFPIAPVLHSDNKLETMNRLGIDLLVDDKLSTINNINSKGINKIGIQFKPYYMTEEIGDKSKIITNINEVNKFIK